MGGGVNDILVLTKNKEISKMKKLLTIILALVMSLSLATVFAACGGDDDSSETSGPKFTTATTIEAAVEILEEEGWTVEALSIDDAQQGSYLASLNGVAVGALDATSADGTVGMSAILFESESSANDYYFDLLGFNNLTKEEAAEMGVHYVGCWYYTTYTGAE